MQTGSASFCASGQAPVFVVNCLNDNNKSCCSDDLCELLYETWFVWWGQATERKGGEERGLNYPLWLCWICPCEWKESEIFVCRGEQSGNCQEQLEHIDCVMSFCGTGLFCLLWECCRGALAFCWVSVVRAPYVNRDQSLDERKGLFSQGYGCLLRGPQPSRPLRHFIN